MGSVNGERFGVMAGTGFDAIMIREADAGLKDRLGRFAYVVTGVRGVGRDPVRTEVEVDGRPWFEGPATCVLVGNMGDVIGGVSAFPDAAPDDGRLNVGVVTADGLVDWARTLGRTVVGDAASSPFVESTTAAKIDVRLDRKTPYEPRRRRPIRDEAIEVPREARRRHGVRARETGAAMSTAGVVPETWELTGDDAKETLARTDRT